MTIEKRNPFKNYARCKMGGNKGFNINIKDYETIRGVLRYFYIYGCFSRNDLKKIISGRKYDNERRRIIYSLKSEYIDDLNIIEGSKNIRIVFDMFRIAGNFLADTYLISRFNRNDVVLFFLILQTLNGSKKALSINEILNSINEALPTDEGLFEEITLRRKLDELVEEGLLAEKKLDKRTMAYSIYEDFFGDIPDEVFSSLFNGVSFFANVAPVSVPGFYLLETLSNYMKYERGLKLPRENIFMYKHYHLHKIIDDEIISVVLQCLHRREKVRFDYSIEDNNKGTDVIVTPLKLVSDYLYGRQYLFAIENLGKKIRLFRIDKIQNIEPANEASGDIDEYSRYEKYIEKSWCATMLKHNKLEKIEVEFRIDEEKEYYIIERLKKEGKWGEIKRIEEGRYLYSIEVTDAGELIPWLRSFAGFVKVIDADGHNIGERLKNEWKETLEKYETSKNI